MSKKLLVAALVAAGCAASMIPATGSREDVTAYVDRAAAVVAAEGGDACGTLRRPRWYSGDWYIFVFDETGRTVCHPARPEMVGTMAHDLVDASGKRFGDEIMRAGASEVGGWVDYEWTRPGGTAHVGKSAYVRSVTARDGKRYILGSGGYEPH